MIIITRTFQKEMKWFSLEIYTEIISLIQKYHKWIHTNLFAIKEYGDYIVLKWYLQWKSVRIIIAKNTKNIYIPLALYKKESRQWYDIRNDFDVHEYMNRTEKCIENDEYEVHII
jgi:hypothetical protein